VNRGSRRVAVVGVGTSRVGRKTGRSARQLTTEAVQAALDDAGMLPSDIDGFTTIGGDSLEDAWMLGIAPVSWFNTASGETPSFSYSALQAIAAVASGFCETCIAVRAIQQQPTAAEWLSLPAAQTYIMNPVGDRQFLAPFGAGSATQWAGLLARRHMEQFGTTEEQFGLHVIAQRAHAALNEAALQRDPLSLEDYFASRYISKPVRLLDCDYPCDAGTAVIFTTEERARDLAKPPAFVESFALSAVQDMNFELLQDMACTAPHHSGRTLWSRTDLEPTDVDCAQLYDGFTIITFQWLEGLGFCAPGEAGPFVEEGHTRLGGRLPVNTDGGACNVGRVHGANFCIEATRQLRGECGARQVPDARVAVWTNGVGPFGGAVLMTKD
jgi:acetyl-CoA acetyltransferase